MGANQDLGVGGGWLAVGLQGSSQGSGSGDGGFDDLSDIEMSYDEAGAAPTEAQLLSDMAGPTLAASLLPTSTNPAREQQQLNFLAQYVVADCGCRTPEQVLSMIARLDKDGTNKSPHTLIQRLYSAAQRARAYAAWTESHQLFAPQSSTGPGS